MRDGVPASLRHAGPQASRVALGLTFNTFACRAECTNQFTGTPFAFGVATTRRTTATEKGASPMNAYVYCWNIRPEAGLGLEVRVTATSAVVARREIRRFLLDHAGGSWHVECVTREATHAPLAQLTLPAEARRSN